MSKRVLTKEELQERITALKQFKSFGRFTMKDGSVVIRAVHIDTQLKEYEKLMETAPNWDSPEPIATAYRKGYRAGKKFNSKEVK